MQDEFDDSDFDSEDLVTITDLDGQQFDCVLVATLEHNGGEFALLARLEQLTAEEGDEIEMFIFHYAVGADGEQVFTSVDDEGLFEAVREEFAVLMDQD